MPFSNSRVISGLGGRLSHERANAAEHEEDDPGADGKEGGELHHRLGRDGQHEPALVLGGIGLPRAEKDGEGRQYKRDQKRHVDRQEPEHAGSLRRIAKNQLNRLRDRLELQGDIRQEPHDRDHGHNRRDGRVLAVARGDKVGDGGDVLRLGQQYDAAQERRRQRKGGNRTKINGDEIEPFCRRRADAPEESPRCAIDAEGKRIDIGPPGQRGFPPSGAISPIGDAK